MTLAVTTTAQQTSLTSRSTTNTIKGSKGSKRSRLRLFSRDATKSKVHPKDVTEVTENDSYSSGVFVTKKPSRCILKIKTQKASLAKPYPKPFICPQCCDCQTITGYSGRKSVSFSIVSIRTFPTILCDNPAVSCGVPIGLGWDVLHERTMTVESHCRFRRNTQTNPKTLLLGSYTRERMLLAQNYTWMELNQALQDVKFVQASRRKNAQIYPAWMYPVLHLFIQTKPVTGSNLNAKGKMIQPGKKAKQRPQKRQNKQTQATKK